PDAPPPGKTSCGARRGHVRCSRVRITAAPQSSIVTRANRASPAQGKAAAAQRPPRGSLFTRGAAINLGAQVPCRNPLTDSDSEIRSNRRGVGATAYVHTSGGSYFLNGHAGLENGSTCHG